jgi:hypothetical protein
LTITLPLADERVAAEAAPEKAKAKVKVTTDFIVKLLEDAYLNSKLYRQNYGRSQTLHAYGIALKGDVNPELSLDTIT